MDYHLKIHGRNRGTRKRELGRETQTEMPEWEKRVFCVSGERYLREMEEAARKIAIPYQTCYMLNGISQLAYLLQLAT